MNASKTAATAIGYSYVRFSARKQRKGSSFIRQTEDTVAGESPETWCARNGVVLDQTLTFRDLGVSAYTGDNAQQGALRAFRDAVKGGRIRPGSYLIVERLDRISRQGVDLGMDIIKEILRAGVFIVTLGNGKVYGKEALTGLMKGLLELQIMLEQAKDYSETLSKRVAVSWQIRRDRARSKGVAPTSQTMPWLRAVGGRDDRALVVVPEKAEVVARIFGWAIEGLGVTRITARLIGEKVRPITGKVWNRTSIRWLLTNRAVLGEYQPCRGDVPDGPPVEGFYPPVIPPGVFAAAQAALGSRRRGKAVRDSKVPNLFAGLLKDAGTGASFIGALRVDRGVRHHVLMTSVKTGGSVSFPQDVFERAVLSMLSEIDPRDLLPPGKADDEVLRLKGELAAVDLEIRSIAEEMDREYSDTLAGVLRRKEAKKRALANALAEASQRATSPLTETWGDAKGLLGLLDGAGGGRDALLLRLRVVLRRLIDCVRVVVVKRGMTRVCAAQVFFAGTERVRSYLIVARPAWASGENRRPGSWSALSLANADALDLRDPAHVKALASRLETLDLSTLTEGL